MDNKCKGCKIGYNIYNKYSIVKSNMQDQLVDSIMHSSS